MFKKYPSIINHYNQKELNTFSIPDDVTWIVYEKLHGSNMSILFDSSNQIRVFSRNNEVTNENFQNSDKAISYATRHLRNFIDSFANQKIRIFGEFIGPKIQKGIDYGINIQFKIFDLMINDEFTSQQFLIKKAFEYDFTFLLAPIVDFIKKDEIFDFPINVNSKILNKENNILEGVVIKPYEKPIYNNYGQILYIKKKNEDFKEKTKKPKVNYSDEVKKWNEEFKRYINKERLESVFSKHDRIKNETQIKYYIQAVLEDAKETFLKEENFTSEIYTKNELKAIFEVESYIVFLLKESLKDG